MISQDLSIFDEAGSSKKPYKVHIISIVDPQLFWFELIYESDTNEPYSENDLVIIQGGLANIFPVNLDFAEPYFETQWKSSENWLPAACRKFQDVINFADEVYFLPVSQLHDDYVLIESTRCIFGKVFVLKNGIVNDVGKILIDADLGYKSTLKFQRFVNTREPFFERDEIIKDKVIDEVLYYINNKEQTVNNSKKEREHAIKLSIKNVEYEISKGKQKLYNYWSKHGENAKEILENMESVFETCLSIAEEEHLSKSFPASRNLRKTRTMEAKEEKERKNMLASAKKLLKKSNPASNVCFVPAGLNLVCDNVSSNNETKIKSSCTFEKTSMKQDNVQSVETTKDVQYYKNSELITHEIKNTNDEYLVQQESEYVPDFNFYRKKIDTLVDHKTPPPISCNQVQDIKVKEQHQMEVKSKFYAKKLNNDKNSKDKAEQNLYKRMNKNAKPFKMKSPDSESVLLERLREFKNCEDFVVFDGITEVHYKKKIEEINVNQEDKMMLINTKDSDSCKNERNMISPEIHSFFKNVHKNPDIKVESPANRQLLFRESKELERSLIENNNSIPELNKSNESASSSDNTVVFNSRVEFYKKFLSEKNNGIINSSKKSQISTSSEEDSFKTNVSPMENLKKGSFLQKLKNMKHENMRNNNIIFPDGKCTQSNKNNDFGAGVIVSNDSQFTQSDCDIENNSVIGIYQRLKKRSSNIPKDTQKENTYCKSVLINKLKGISKIQEQTVFKDEVFSTGEDIQPSIEKALSITTQAIIEKNNNVDEGDVDKSCSKFSDRQTYINKIKSLKAGPSKDKNKLSQNDSLASIINNDVETNKCEDLKNIADTSNSIAREQGKLNRLSIYKKLRQCSDSIDKTSNENHQNLIDNSKQEVEYHIDQKSSNDNSVSSRLAIYKKLQEVSVMCSNEKTSCDLKNVTENFLSNSEDKIFMHDNIDQNLYAANDRLINELKSEPNIIDTSQKPINCDMKAEISFPNLEENFFESAIKGNIDPNIHTSDDSIKFSRLALYKKLHSISNIKRIDASEETRVSSESKVTEKKKTILSSEDRSLIHKKYDNGRSCQTSHDDDTTFKFSHSTEEKKKFHEIIDTIDTNENIVCDKKQTDKSITMSSPKDKSGIYEIKDIDQNISLPSNIDEEVNEKVSVFNSDIESSSDPLMKNDQKSIQVDITKCDSKDKEKMIETEEDDPELVLDIYSPSKKHSRDCSVISLFNNSDSSIKSCNIKSGNPLPIVLSDIQDKKESGDKIESSPLLECENFDYSVGAIDHQIDDANRIEESHRNSSPTSYISSYSDFSQGSVSVHKLKQNNMYIQFTQDCNHAENFSDENDLVESILTPKLIIHSRNNNICSSWNELSSTSFSSSVLNNLRNMGVKTPGKLQSSVWPTICRGGSVFVVGPPFSGRGLSILTPVCNQLLNVLLSDLPQTHGPLFLIVCPDANIASRTYNDCMSLLTNCTTFNGKQYSVMVIDNSNKLNNVWEFYKCVDILITTPLCLFQYLKYDVAVVNLRRLLYLYFEDLDVLNEKFSFETDFIFTACQNAVKERGTHDLKVFGTTKIWCNILHKIGTESVNPNLIIGALQECIFYSGMLLNIKFVLNSNKLICLKNILNNDRTMLKKTIILCKNDNEVLVVYDALMADQHVLMKVETSMSLEELNNIRLNWKNFKVSAGNLIMICCDESLQFLNITNVHWLIHYSLPKTYTRFNIRFSTLSNNYPNLYLKNNRSNIKLKVHVFVDEKNTVQLPKILQFSKRYGVEVPPKVDELLQDILNVKDVKKADEFVPLCDRLMAFGECPDNLNCIERHSIVPSDKLKDWIPRTGVVKCKVLIVHNTALFSARILEHVDDYGTTKIQQRNICMSTELATYFSSLDNRICLGSVNLGDICAVHTGTSYERCQIVRLIHNNKKGFGDVLVNLLDEETYIKAKYYDLYYLPEHFKKISSTAVKIRLVNLIPSNSNPFWTKSSIQNIKKILSSHNDLFIKGNIVLGIENTLWLDNVQICRYLKTLRIDVVKCNVKKNILSNGYAVENPSHLTNLYKLCHRFKFELPSTYQVKAVGIKQTEKKKLSTPYWAHFNENEYIKVYFCSAISPEKFFLRIYTHQRVLDDLEDDLQIYVKTLQEKFITFDDNVTDDVIRNGLYCIAKFIDDGLFYRSRIDKIIDDKYTGNRLYTCFFVDHGDSRNVKPDDIFPINDSFITRMPFQAIECRLYGLQSKEKGWSDFETDMLYDWCFINDSCDLKVLLIKYYSKEQSEFTKGHKYGVVLVDLNNGESFADNLLERNIGKIHLDEMDRVKNDDSVLRDFMNKMQECLDTNSECFDDIQSDDKEPELENLIDFSDDEFEDEWDCQFYTENLKNIENQKKLPRICEEDSNFKKKLCITPKSDEDDFVVVRQNSPKKTELKDELKYFDNMHTKPTHRTPNILWHQNDSFVTVKIQLSDINIYECNISVKNLYFESFLNGESYKVDLELYGGVKVKKSFHASKGQYVLVKMRKLTKMVWDSLTNSKIKEKRIVYDADFIYMEDDSSSDTEERIKMGIKQRDNELMNAESDQSDKEDDNVLNEYNFIETDLIDKVILREIQNIEYDEDDDDDEYD